MFTILPKSETAKEKADLLTPLELAHIDMCLTVAFTRPDSYMRLVDAFTALQQGSIFDFFVVELPELALVLAVSRSGKMAIIDFVIFDNLGFQPEQANA
jgi:hypothetical protein